MIDERDERLGYELRALDVPDHGPDFFLRLSERLEEAPAATVHRPRWQRPPMLMMMAIAAVVVGLVAMSTQFTRNEGSPLRPQTPEPELITATEIRSRLSIALAALRSLTGEITIDCVASCPYPTGGPTAHWSFVTTAAGDMRVTGIGSPDDYAYSATRRELRIVTANGPRLTAQVTTNVAPGPPDFPPRSPLARQAASMLQAFPGTIYEVPVTEVTEQDRPAWRMVTPVVPNKLAGPGRSADQIEVVVDRQTGFPVRTTETFGGKLLNEVRLSNLVVNGPVDPASFTFEVPAGVQVFARDAGFHPVNLGEVEALVGYRPVLPTAASIPPGFLLSEVTVSTVAVTPGSEGMNAPSPRVVSVTYRRGFDRITVTTRASGGAVACSPAVHATCFSDPLASGEGDLDNPERFTVHAGALAGAQADLLISPRSTPHVWTVDDRLVVTVAGDVNGGELKQMAESFAVAG